MSPLHRLNAALAELEQAAIAVSGGIDSLTLRNGGSSGDGQPGDDAPRHLSRRARRSDGADAGAGGGAGMDPGRVRRRGVCRSLLPRQSGEPLLLLQDQPIRCSRCTDDPDHPVRHEPG